MANEIFHTHFSYDLKTWVYFTPRLTSIRPVITFQVLSSDMNMADGCWGCSAFILTNLCIQGSFCTLMRIR